MVSECMECRKWEEDMYWSRFHTLQFFQFLSGSFDQQLAIPEKFRNSLREKLAGTIALSGPSGHVWNVGAVTEGDTLLLKHGWKAFVEDHSLEENDILIFKYNGNSRFDVVMFDQKSQCEKAASYFIRKCDHTERGRGSKRRRSLEYVEDTSESSEDAAGNHQAKRPKRDAARPSASRVQPARSTARCRRGAKKGRGGSSGAYPLQLKSRRREVTEEEKNRVQQMAVEAATSNNFIVVMRASHVYKGFFMSIPAEWARVHLPGRNQDIELRVGERAWQATYQFKGYGGGLVGGWRTFVLENFLEEFDVCVFDPVSGTQDALVLDVKIFRVVEEVIPPSVVTRGSARGTPRRRSTRNARDLSSDEEDE